MADSKDQGEKTEEPTQQRREEFRKRGQVAQTRELASAMLLLSSLLVIWMLGRFFLEQMYMIFNQSFGDYLVASVRSGEWIAAVKFAASKTFLILAPALGLLWMISFFSSTVQVGFLVNEDALKPKPERLNPVEGFKRIFSLRSLFEGLKAVLKVILVSAIAYLVLQSEISAVPQLVNFSVEQLFVYLGDIVLKLVGGTAAFMLVLAGIDYLFQRWDLEQKMRMTKQEVKEELKSREGDPLIKARVRKVQRELANRRMMEAVPTADVIITNPTHIAVAVKYDNAAMAAPQIVAKGADYVAEKIKELARESGVPVVENKPLARTMYKTLKIGQQIPRELYTAVAEVLSYVYRLKRKAGR